MKNELFDKGDPCFVITKNLFSSYGYIWKQFADTDSDKPIGYNYVIVFDELFLDFNDYQKIIQYTYSRLFDNKSIALLDSSNCLVLKYKKQHLLKIEKRIAFLQKRKKTYEKWYNKALFFSDDFIEFKYTWYSRYIINDGKLLICFYYLFKVFFIAKWISKIFFYPIIFIIESISTSYGTFIDYKVAKSEHDRYVKYNRNYGYLGNSQAETNARIDELYKEVRTTRDKFLESGKFISTLIASIITISISITIGIYSSITKDISIAEKNESIKTLTTEVEQLKQDISDKNNEILDYKFNALSK